MKDHVGCMSCEEEYNWPIRYVTGCLAKLSTYRQKWAPSTFMHSVVHLVEIL